MSASALGASSAGSSSFSGGTSNRASAGSSSTRPSSNGRRDRAPKAKHLQSSRAWIGIDGKRSRRATKLTFVLSHAGDVVFIVEQVSPSCSRVGRFIVHAHAGLNRVRFAARVGRERLGAGTYRITARTAAGRSVQRVTLVVIEGTAPTPSELVSLRSANACGAENAIASTAAVRSKGALNPGVLSDSAQNDGPSAGAGQPSASAPAQSTQPKAGGVLASAADATARAIRPALVALLLIAIALLGVASLPRVAVTESRFNDALARHRLEIAGLGAAALVAVVIAFLL
jgi:hypothetical protein